MHAEAMLFIDHGEREIVEGDVFLKQRVGADQKVDIAKHETIQDLLAGGPAFAAGQDGNAEAGGLGQRGDRCEMLARENFGRRHNCGLSSRLDHSGGGRQRDYCLSGPDVALQEPQHALRVGRDR